MDIKHLRPQFAYTAGRNNETPRLGELMQFSTIWPNMQNRKQSEKRAI